MSSPHIQIWLAHYVHSVRLAQVAAYCWLAGFMLGGGQGDLSRMFGLACDQLVSWMDYAQLDVDQT
jgi:hypothetical protein